MAGDATTRSGGDMTTSGAGTSREGVTTAGCTGLSVAGDATTMSWGGMTTAGSTGLAVAGDATTTSWGCVTIAGADPGATTLAIAAFGVTCDFMVSSFAFLNFDQYCFITSLEGVAIGMSPPALTSTNGPGVTTVVGGRTGCSTCTTGVALATGGSTGPGSGVGSSGDPSKSALT